MVQASGYEYMPGGFMGGAFAVLAMTKSAARTATVDCGSGQTISAAHPALSGVTISANGHDAIETAQNGVAHIVKYQDMNTISEALGNTKPLFGCYRGGKVYVDQIAGNIMRARSAADQTCLTVKGPQAG